MTNSPGGQAAEGRSQRRRIGVDVRTLYYRESVARGIGHYAENHIRHAALLRPDWEFSLLSEFSGTSEPIDRLLDLPNVRLSLIEEFRPADVDLVHITDPMNLDPAYDSPMRVFLGCRTTVTFYDLIPLRVYWSVWPQASKDAYLMRLCHLKNGRGQILAISEFTRKDLIDALEFPAHRVHAVMAGLHPSTRTGEIGPDEVRRVKEKYGIDKPFFLHVGAVDSHKNFVSVLKAMALLRWAEDVQLVVAGKVESQLKSMSRFTDKLRAGTLVSPGFVPRADLEILYREAIALVFLSVYEGFGLPVLEAMANSCPVITTNATSIPEVAGDAAILCQPFDIEAVSRKMEELIVDPARGKALRKAGLGRAAQFTWEETARRTVAIWERMMVPGDEESLSPAESPTARSPYSSPDCLVHPA